MARRLLASLTAAPAAAARADATRARRRRGRRPTPSGDLVGRWRGDRDGSTFDLSLDGRGRFVWQAARQGKPTATVSGAYALSGDTLTLKADDRPPLRVSVTESVPDSFRFKTVGGHPRGPGSWIPPGRHAGGTGPGPTRRAAGKPLTAPESSRHPDCLARRWLRRPRCGPAFRRAWLRRPSPSPAEAESGSVTTDCDDRCHKAEVSFMISPRDLHVPRMLRNLGRPLALLLLLRYRRGRRVRLLRAAMARLTEPATCDRRRRARRDPRVSQQHQLRTVVGGPDAVGPHREPLAVPGAAGGRLQSPSATSPRTAGRSGRPSGESSITRLRT